MKRMLLTAGFAGIIAAALTACAPETAPASETAATPEAAAPAAPAIPASADVHPFQIGDMQAAALRDGDLQAPNDNKTLAVNKTKAEVDAVLTANGLPTDVLSLSVQPLLVKSADKVFLFDTGAAALFGPTAGKLPQTLAAAAVEPSAVTDIFISHAHGDHVGGLVTAEGELAYVNATVHMSANEWAAMQSEAQLAPIVTAIAPRVATFEPGADLVPGVKAVDIKGHTAGHSGYLIGSVADSILYIGDMAHHSVISVQQPDWTIAFDGNAPTAEASRKEFIASAASSGQRIYAIHFPFPGLGRFEQRDTGYVWTAE